MKCLSLQGRCATPLPGANTANAARSDEMAARVWPVKSSERIRIANVPWTITQRNDNSQCAMQSQCVLVCRCVVKTRHETIIVAERSAATQFPCVCVGVLRAFSPGHQQPPTAAIGHFPWSVLTCRFAMTGITRNHVCTAVVCVCVLPRALART